MTPRHAGMALGLALGVACAGKKSDDAAPSSAQQIKEALADAPELPLTLTETKLFAEGDLARPAEGLVAYDVKAPLWSDGAAKQRWVVLPPDGKVGLDPETGRFAYPVGTTFVKHFATPEETPHPIETRVMTLRSDGAWAFATYVWDETGSAVKRNLPGRVTGHDGLPYRVPSEKECVMCHVVEGGADPVLGFSREQLEVYFEDVPQVARLAEAGVFQEAPEALLPPAPLPSFVDAAVSLDERTRSYFAVNCASCHRPGGPADAESLDLRWGVPFADTGLVAEGKVVPGDPAQSILWQKYTAEEERMPALSVRADSVGLELIKAWIEGLEK